MSLRTRLLAGMFFLVSVALVVAAASIYAADALSDFLHAAYHAAKERA